MEQQKRPRGRPVKFEPSQIIQVRIESRYVNQIPKPHSEWCRNVILAKLADGEKHE